MPSDPDPDPDQPARTIYVGQDSAGHWLVQDDRRSMEGRFVSYGAALHYAQAERDMYHASLEIAAAPLTPLISFAPVARDERAWPCAA
jgi:hypothetical protein